MSLFLQHEFDVSDVMPLHAQRIVDTYRKNIDTSQGYNVCYNDEEFNAVVCQRFWRVLNELFDLGSEGKVGYTWAYVQNHQASSNYWHNHINTSTINAVFHWNVPKEGGELEICVPQGHSVHTHMIRPRENSIMLFPYWLYHRPCAQISSETRISINIEYFSRTRARVRSTGELW